MTQRENSERDRQVETGEAATPSEGRSIVRHEEQLDVTARPVEQGAVRASKRIEKEQVREVVPRSIEHFDGVERTDPKAADSGEVEVLPDGSVSIPILEEELVIEKRMVVRERVVIRKRTETRQEQVEATVRKERVEIEPDDVSGRIDEVR